MTVVNARYFDVKKDDNIMKKFQIKYKDVTNIYANEWINIKTFDDVLFKDQYVIATTDDDIPETLYIPYYSILNMKAIRTDEIKIDPVHP